MRTKYKTCFRCSPPGGLTLIEVVAAITILGTILVGVVLAKARHTHQIALTQKLNRAVQAGDELISNWWTSQAGVPIGRAGVLGADGWLTWQTRIVGNPVVEKLGARVVRVEFRESRPSEKDQQAGCKALAVVDLVLSDPRRDVSPQGTGVPAAGKGAGPSAAAPGKGATAEAHGRATPANNQNGGSGTESMAEQGGRP